MKSTLKSAILIPFAIVFLITFLSISVFQLYRAEQRMDRVSIDKMSLISNGIHTKLDNFLREPLHLGLTISDVISSSHQKEENDLYSTKASIYSSFSDVYHLLPQVQLMGFGYENGDFFGFRKGKEGQDHLLLKDSSTNGNLIFFSDHSAQSEPLMTVANYDPVMRPWYQSAIDAKEPVWSSLYNSFDIYNESNATISAVVPIQDSLDKVNGVLTVDISIERLTNFLIDLKNQYNVTVFIFNNQGNVVSYSGNENIGRSKNLSSAISNYSVDPVISSSLSHVIGLNESDIGSEINYKTNIGGEVYYNSVSPYINIDMGDLRWFIGVSVSKNSLLQEPIKDRVIAFFIGIITCLIGYFLTALYVKKVISPINSMITVSNEIAQGTYVDKVLKSSKIKEVQTLVTSFNRMSNKVNDTIVKLKYQAYHDKLTGLLSKQGLIECHKDMNSQNSTLFLFSICDFRMINNSLGYVKGDFVLKELARKLSKFAEEGCLTARTDGGKFALVVPSAMGVNKSKAYAMSIKQILTERLSVDNVDVVFRISVGIVTDCAKYPKFDQCLRYASIALSNGKKERHGRILHFDSEMLEQIEDKTQMCAAISTGIENQEFVPFYQPIVDLKTGKIVGAEALARWLSPSLGMVPPDKFISVAEESGFIDKLGESILCQACTDLGKGIREGKWDSDFKMHVNISVIQLQSSTFLSSLQEIMSKTNIRPKNLSLEITESGLAENKGILSSNLEVIIAMGIEVAIDDFGTGYSSLSYLRDLNFHCLKIDRAFISTLQEENADTSLTAMILNISKTFNSFVVAEGIETESQLNSLLRLNCEYGQGYYFGKPAPYESWNY